MVTSNPPHSKGRPEMSLGKLLIVDDDPDLLRGLSIRLRAAGYVTIQAEDGLEGLNAVHREQPDLVLLDLMLPTLDGFRVCRMLKFDERYARLPIIILSARDREEDRALALEVGASRFLTKPYEISVLLSHIEGLLGPSRAGM